MKSILRTIVSGCAAPLSLLNFKCFGGMTALHTAVASYADVSVLSELAMAGVNCFACDDAGRNMAHYVAVTRAPDAADHGARLGSAFDWPAPDVRSDVVERVAAWIVATVPELLDTCDNAGNTPLHSAAQFGCVPATITIATAPMRAAALKPE